MSTGPESTDIKLRGIRFLGLELKPGFSALNVTTVYMVMFVGGLVMSFMSTFLSYIVKSPEYYNVPQNETASTLGDLGFYSELVLFPCHLLLGSLMDIVGRKLPTTVGLFGCAMAIACIPYGHKVYPDLCLMR